VGKVIAAALVCQKAAGVIKKQKLFPRGGFEVIQFRNGSLFIKVKSSSVASKINSNSEELIKEINQELGKDLVKKLSFRL